MKGHDQLIAMRRAGKRPRAVYLTDADDTYTIAMAATWHMRPHCHTGEAIAHIRIERTDLAAELPLGFLCGLECHVSSERGDSRFLRLFQAVSDAGASAVAGLSEGQVHVFKPTATEENK